VAFLRLLPVFALSGRAASSHQPAHADPSEQKRSGRARFARLQAAVSMLRLGDASRDVMPVGRRAAVASGFRAAST
jgi:hypothetical protein